MLMDIEKQTYIDAVVPSDINLNNPDTIKESIESIKQQIAIEADIMNKKTKNFCRVPGFYNKQLLNLKKPDTSNPV